MSKDSLRKRTKCLRSKNSKAPTSFKKKHKLLCKSNDSMHIKDLRKEIRVNFPGCGYKEVKEDPVKDKKFTDILERLSKKHGNTLHRKQVTDLFWSIIRTAKRRTEKAKRRAVFAVQKCEPEESLISLQDLRADEELKEPDLQRYMQTRSRAYLPTPGLITGTQIKPIGELNQHPVYRERDLPFTSILSKLLEEYQPEISDREADRATPSLDPVYHKKKMPKLVGGMIQLVSQAPIFVDDFDFDEHGQPVFTFSWRTICKIAERQNMPPFDMLAYATLLSKFGESDYCENLHEIVGSRRWYEKIPGTIPLIEVPVTCPLTMYAFSPMMNLSAQVQKVRYLYEKYPFYHTFGGSHALFLDFALKAEYNHQPFHQALDLDVDNIQELEETYFKLTERVVAFNFGTFTIQEPIRGPIPMVVHRQRVYAPAWDDTEEQQEAPYVDRYYGDIADYGVDHVLNRDDIPFMYIGDLVPPEDNMLATPLSCSTTSNE